MTDRPGWWKQAACHGRDRNIFYDAYRVADALRICATCDVKAVCLADDLAYARQPVNICGVRGGLTEKDRRKLWRRGRRAA